MKSPHNKQQGSSSSLRRDLFNTFTSFIVTLLLCLLGHASPVCPVLQFCAVPIFTIFASVVLVMPTGIGNLFSAIFWVDVYLHCERLIGAKISYTSETTEKSEFLQDQNFHWLIFDSFALLVLESTRSCLMGAHCQLQCYLWRTRADTSNKN